MGHCGRLRRRTSNFQQINHAIVGVLYTPRKPALYMIRLEICLCCLCANLEGSSISRASAIKVASWSPMNYPCFQTLFVPPHSLRETGLATPQRVAETQWDLGDWRNREYLKSCNPKRLLIRSEGGTRKEVSTSWLWIPWLLYSITVCIWKLKLFRDQFKTSFEWKSSGNRHHSSELHLWPSAVHEIHIPPQNSMFILRWRSHWLPIGEYRKNVGFPPISLGKKEKKKKKRKQKRKDLGNFPHYLLSFIWSFNS